MSQNQLTKEYIQDVLARDDSVGMHAIGRALVHIFNRQTADEQEREETSHLNGRGFTGVDAKIGSSMAKFYTRNNRLSPKQMVVWQKPSKTGTSKIGKYWKQLLEEAQAKQGVSNE